MHAGYSPTSAVQPILRGVDLLIAIDTLDDLVHEAKAVPLTDQVRMKHDELRRHAGDVLDALSPQQRARAEAEGLPERLETVLRDAKPVPLTDQVRIGKDEIYAILDALRALV
jgi:hypothetical protein